MQDAELEIRFLTAQAIAREAGATMRRRFLDRSSFTLKMKGRQDYLTEVDGEIEALAQARFSAVFPGDGMIGEEGAGRPTAPGGGVWVVDPIDGTRAFILGLPLWGTLIGLLEGAKPILGLMDQPYTRERFWTTEKASFMRDTAGKERRLRTRACRSLADAMLTTTHPDMFKAGEESERFQGLARSVRMTRYGGDCYAYCMLAAGHLDLVVETELKPYDIAALIPIITGAGGVVSTWDGKPAQSGGRIVAAGDPRVHEAAMKILNS